MGNYLRAEDLQRALHTFQSGVEEFIAASGEIHKSKEMTGTIRAMAPC